MAAVTLEMGGDHHKKKNLYENTVIKYNYINFSATSSSGGCRREVNCIFRNNFLWAHLHMTTEVTVV